MTRYTPSWSLRYPDASDAADPVAVQNLATDIDAVHASMDTLRTAALHRPRAQVINTGSQSVAKATHVTATYNTVSWDNNSMANLGTNNTRLTVQKVGIYLFQFRFDIPSLPSMGTNGVIQPSVAKNGATSAPGFAPIKIWVGTLANSGALEGMTNSAWAVFAMAVGDFVTGDMWWNGSPAGPLTASGQTMTAWMICTNP